MPDYKKGKIYCIKNDDLKIMYIGSTTQNLSRRFTQHKADVNKEHRYLTSKKCFETDNVMIDLIEKFPCETKHELWNRERYFMENNPFNEYSIINKCYPLRTRQEYYQANKKLLDLKRKVYYYKNIDQERERAKQRYYDKKDELLKSWTCPVCGGSVSKIHFARHCNSKKHKRGLELQKIKDKEIELELAFN